MSSLVRPGENYTCIDKTEFSPDKVTVSVLISMLQQLIEKGLGDKEVYMAPEGKPCRVNRISILQGAYPIVID